MATVVAEMTMSLDGFVADPSDGVQELFGWYDNGDVAVPTADPEDGWLRDDAPFTFVTDGVESAVAEAESIAGDRVVGVGGADIAQQCLDAGLLDEVHVNYPVMAQDGWRKIAFAGGLGGRDTAVTWGIEGPWLERSGVDRSASGS